ncbi:ROK family protein [Kaistia geumhonensis]|uniref:Glucokinase n=1 Tax=Kaistia geumhonensis TaxID=410839 RepID=A0ABU0M9Y0_9HYPH|nr:ROK family protein [Kaistia geumhonensis]MCX5480531.1 ROK family protein [Kaistia geumhonensis]MDQ0517767.1 glucokinase [Kaistia geumhonensis]
MSRILAIDLGGTHYRAATAFTSDPSLVATLETGPAPRDRATFLALVERLLAETQADRLGLGVPGLARGTLCRWVPNLPWLDGLDLSVALPAVTVGLGNDAQFALLAEAKAGAALGAGDALLVAIGTGIGSAVLAGGRIIAGAGGGACSFGWAAADLEDPGEDVSGWLERHASGRALDAAARSIGLQAGEELIAAARGGDARALAALDAPAAALGTALAGAVGLLDPAVVILAGGVARALDMLGPKISAALDRQLPPHLRGVPLRAAHFGSSAGLVGAAFAGAAGSDWRSMND